MPTKTPVEKFNGESNGLSSLNEDSLNALEKQEDEKMILSSFLTAEELPLAPKAMKGASAKAEPPAKGKYAFHDDDCESVDSNNGQRGSIFDLTKDDAPKLVPTRSFHFVRLDPAFERFLPQP